MVLESPAFRPWEDVNGAQVAVALTVPIRRERMWDLVTAVDRIGEWSQEATGAGGAREEAKADPRTLDSRLVPLCRNMTTTIAAMATADSTMGAIR
jgi:hypothetical protein